MIAIENVRLFKELTQKTSELETSNSELRETFEQQTATSEILGVIASSPTEIQPVWTAVAENAATVCGASDAVIRLVEGNCSDGGTLRNRAGCRGGDRRRRASTGRFIWNNARLQRGLH